MEKKVSISDVVSSNRIYTVCENETIGVKSRKNENNNFHV